MKTIKTRINFILNKNKSNRRGKKLKKKKLLTEFNTALALEPRSVSGCVCKLS